MFASEIKAILAHPAVTADLDEEAFTHYLTFVCTPAPATMFARHLQARAGGAHARARRRLGRPARDLLEPDVGRGRQEVAALSEAELPGARCIELLRASIAKRMMSDVPFGVFLSGGVDSSTNVALMDELMDEPVRTFSVGFSDHERYNELQYARRIAERFKTDHHEILIDDADLVDFLPAMIHHQDEPIADWVCVPLHYVASLARESGTIVVQIGEGSDEIFHGYANYLDAVARRRRYWEPFQRVPGPLRRATGRAATALARRSGRGLLHAAYLSDAAQGRQPFWGGAIAYQGQLKAEILANGGASADSYAIVERFWEEAERDRPGADLLAKMSYLELKQRLAELLLMRVDKMTMATSVEAREPVPGP